MLVARRSRAAKFARVSGDRAAAVCTRWIVALVATVTLALPKAADAQFEDLLRRIPQGANAILLFDVDAVNASPLAQKEGWTKKHEAAYVARPIILPPEASKLVIAAQLDVAQNFGEAWELAVMSLSEPLSMRSIARAEAGYVDTINGLESAWTPSDAYFVQLDKDTMGVMYPGNRQFVSRWADFGRANRDVVLSPYLRAAASSANAGNPIVMAIDLKDVVRPHLLEDALKESEALKGNQKTIDQVKALFPTIQGITLEVTLSDEARGTMRVDFADSTAFLGRMAKPLLLEALNQFEVNIGDFEKWTVEASGKSVEASGALSENGMRRLFSLLELPTSKFSTIEEEDFSPGDPAAMAKIQKTYFDSVNVLMDDLESTLKDTKDNHAVWMERYGRKIDRLPILNVDEELLTYGATVAESFRNMALAKRNAGMRTGVRSSAVYGNYTQYGGNYGNSGYVYKQDNTAVRNEIRVQERAKANALRFQSWKDLEDLRATTRKELTQKYQIEF